MITFFTIPKPFVGDTATQQRNAIESWKAISGSEILLYGNDKGVAETAEQYELIHIPDISLSAYGTPYLDDVFYDAQKRASNAIVCYVNSDILINGIDIPVASIKGSDFLMTGKRIDIETATYQKMYPGMDWFAFPKGMITDMPHFIVGRRGWDNWMVYHCRSRGIPVIDATGFVRALHPNHDYNHVPESNGCGWWKCPESDHNIGLLKNRIIYLWEIDDATHSFNNDCKMIKKPMSLRDITQGAILKTPEKFHWVIDPFYRCGHIARYLWLKVAT
jgi:hypothetical protein